MSKDESSSRFGLPGASETALLEPRGGSGSNRPPAGPRWNRLYRSWSDGHGNGHQPCRRRTSGDRICSPSGATGKLAALGLKPTTNIANLFDCEIVISMLPDDDAVREIVFGREAIGLDGLAQGLRPGAVHLSMSTISTAAASELASEHAINGQGYVAAPVFGNPDAAKARQLYIVAAGAPADVERCRPLLDSLGQQTFVVGADPAQANLIKLLGNMMTATTLEMLGEVVAVFRKRGLDPTPFLDILTNTMFGGRAHKIYGEKILGGAVCAGIPSAPGAQGCAPGACRGGKRRRPDAVGRRRTRPDDHRYCSRLRRSRLDSPRTDRRGRGRTSRPAQPAAMKAACG